MATDEYNFNFNQFTKPSQGGSAGGIAGKAGSSSSADSAMLTKLAKLITQLYKEQSKQSAKILEAAAAKMIRGALSGGGSGLDKATINKLVKDMSKEVADGVAKGMLKSVSGTVSKSSGGIGTGGIDETKLSKNIASGIDRSVDRQSKLLAAELRKRTGVSIDENALARALSGAVKNAFPKSTETALKDFTQAAGSLKNLGRDISRLVQAISSMRRSGGGIDVAEIGPVIQSLKVIFKDFQQLSSESTKAKESLKALGLESKETVRQLNKAIDDFKKSAGQTVSGVKQRAKDDPAKFRREMITAVSQAISKSSTLKDTEFAKAIRSLEGKQGDIDKLTKEFNKFYALLSRQAKGGKVKIEGIEQVLREFGNISRSVGNVPRQFGGNAPKDWEKSAKKMEMVLNKIADLSQELRVVINDKELNKLKKTKIAIDLVVNDKTVKAIHDDVVNAIRSALEEASRAPVKTKMEIIPIAKDVVMAIETGDLDKSIKSLEKLASQFPATLKASGPQADVARKRVAGLKATAGAGWFATEGPEEYLKILKEKNKKSGNALEKLANNIEAINKDLQATDVSKSMMDVSDSATTLSQRLDDGARGVKDLAEVKKVTPKINELQKSIDFVNSQFKRGLTTTRPTSEITTQRAPSVRSIREASDRMRQDIYPQRLIRPDMTGVATTGPKVYGEAKKIQEAVNKNITELSNSLAKLQKTIVDELDKSFKEVNKSWDIIRPSKESRPGEIFEHTGGRTGGRQWKIDIANIASLRKATGSGEKSTKKLLETYIDEQIEKSFGKLKTDEASELIGRWLKTVTDAQIESLSGLEQYETKLKEIKNAYKSSPIVSEDMAGEIKKKIGSKESVREVFKRTYGESFIRDDLREKKLLRTIAIPAAKTTGTGGTAFETQHGVKRGLPKFAVFETGFELLYDTLQKNIKTAERAADYADPIRKLGVRPSAKEIASGGEDLAKNMLADLASIDTGALARQYKRAAVPVGLRQERITGVPAEQFINQMNDLVNKQIGQSPDKFINAMDDAGIKAYDVVRSLDKIKFENVYDIYTKLLTAGRKGTSVMENLAKSPYYDKPVRDYETAIRELEGTLPLVESTRPRRGIHQEKVVSLMTRTSPIYGEKRQQDLDAPQQKKLIRDLNLRINEILIEASKIDQGKLRGGIVKSRREQLPTDIRTLSSLGVPESQAAKIEDYRAKKFDSSTKYLDKLNTTIVKMYADNLSELAPFGAEFQQAGRNISNVTNALMGGTISGRRRTIETPKLRTEREKALIESGRYGTKGYGYNVTAELRNTASTFEDQVVVSGRLAKALTLATKKLIKPTRHGRRDEYTGHLMPETTDIKPGTYANTLKEDVQQVHKEFMKILGMPEEYEGRADKALIENVEKAMSVVRSKPVEIQTAQLAEVFMNYYGRKFTTRYGSKGVGVAPAGTAGEIVEKFGGKDIKIKPSESLGYAKMPKTMGELASEILIKIMGEKESAELRKQLIASGNRFVIDMFKTGGKSGITIEPEARKQRELFKKFNEAIGDKLIVAGRGADTSKVTIENIQALKTLYKTEVGGDKFKRTPIDVRISSYGAAKRGLQTEVLESVMSNVAGHGRTGMGKEVTMKTRLGKPAYEKLLGAGGEAGALAKYSRELGYLPSETISKGGGVEDIKRQLVGKTEDAKKLAIAQRAAELEAISSYYAEIIDEMGQERRSLVGEKFLQIIEEPHKDPGWSKREIDKGMKGAKLNLLAFPAYATIFGEQSALLEEMAQGGGVDTKKHYEYIKALQFLNDESSMMTDEMLKSLKKVDISEVRPFERSTGIRGLSPDATKRSLESTVLDTAKFPQAFNLQLPTGKLGPEGEVLKEDFYVPGASARGTYPDKLIAGEEGMDLIARRLTHITNMANQLNAVLTEGPDTEKAKEKLTKIVAGFVQKAQEEPNINRLKDIYNQLFAGLDPNEFIKKDLAVSKAKEGLTETEYVRSFLKDESVQSYRNAISQQVDILAGARTPFAGKQRQLVTPKIAEVQDVSGLAADLGIDITQDEINRRIEALTKAKIDYYNSLAETTLGKSGSVQELLFTKQIPSVMAKATTAVVDRRSELQDLASTLDQLTDEYGLNLKSLSETAAKIGEDHADKIEKTLRSGLPVLKQHELGIPAGLAEKVPTKFAKPYSITGKEGKIKALQPGKYGTGRSLAELMEYREELMAGLETADKDLRKEIEAYIKDNLTPYVEAIRYPFTGISSVQPFEAKLLDQVGPRGLERHSLSVPGVPEMDVRGFDELLEKLKDKASELSAKREKQRLKMEPEEEIQKTTDALNKLEAAISSATPKYIAHQMKLDFDGDEIQVHSARTAQARQEIEKHYKSLVDVNKALSTTAGRYREGFTYENLPSTGENTIAEMMMAFDKKFGGGKGFEFLKSPFLTRELEYLKPAERLSVLSESRPDIDTPLIGIEEVLKNLGKSSKDIAEISEALSKVQPSEDATEYSGALLATLNKLNAELGKEVEIGVIDKLFEEKFSDVIAAQLFKIHTGPETEAMGRLQRLGESAVGFGTGVMGAADKKYMPTPTFKKRYPGSIQSLGIDASEEFHTMLNEVFRFAIQKGMDVKHAGEEPIAGELVRYISKGVGGAEGLWKKIEKDDAYSELKELYEASNKAIMYNLGEQPTKVIRKVAGDIAGARKLPVDVSDMARGELTQLITDSIGFKGFLEELSLMVKESAIESLIQQAKTWKPGQSGIKGVDPVKGEIEDWARDVVESQMSTGGIDIRSLITEGQNPLYGFRTRDASTYTQLEKYKAKYGDIAPPKEITEGFADKDAAKNYIDKYKKAKATASNLREELMKVSQTPTGKAGGYSLMVESGIEDIQETQMEIEKILESWKAQSFEPRTGDLLGRLDRLYPTEARVVGKDPKERNRELERLMELTGAPKVTHREKLSLEQEYGSELVKRATKAFADQGLSEEEFNTKIDAFVSDALKKIEALEQLDRIYAIIESKKGDAALIRSLFSAGGVDTSQDIRRRKEADARARAQARPLDYSRTIDRPTPMERAEDGGAGAGGAGLGRPSGDPVPVYLVGVEAGLLSKFKDANTVLSSSGVLGPMVSAATKRMDEMRSQDAELEKIMTILRSVGEGAGGTGSFSDLFSPSRLAGGGKYGKYGKDITFDPEKWFENQVDEIVTAMTGGMKPNERMKASADLGTLVHEKLQKTTFNDPKYSIEELIRIPEEDTGFRGEVVGFADVVERAKDKSVKKVIDIKTTDKKILREIQKTGSEDLKNVIANVDDRTRFAIEKAYSQVNTYLKAMGDQLAEGAKGEIRFYERSGKDLENPAVVSFSYSPERFERDMQAVAKARAKVLKEGGKFGTLPTYAERSAPKTKPDISVNELDKAIEYAFRKYQRSSMRFGGGPKAREDDDIVADRIRKATERAMSEASGIGGGGYDYNQFLEAPPIAEGKGLLGVFENIKTLHQQASLYQKKYNDISDEIFNIDDGEGAKRIKAAIDEIRGKTGPSGQKFIELLNELQQADLITGKDAWKAWRLYRIASGDFLIRQAEKAKADADSLRDTDKAAAEDKYAEFERHTKRLQEHIRRSVGKRTDIYTENRKFLYPGLAQAAGVYLNPQQITRRATEPLGEDKDLIKVFKSLTSDLKGGADVIPPVEKVREALATLTKVKPELVAMLTSAEKFSRMGDEVQEAWTFTGLAENITKLRAGLEGLTRFNLDDFGVVQQKNIKDMIKYLKSLENAYANAGKADFASTGFGQTGIVRVPTFESPENQLAMHRRNIQRAREYAKRSEEDGGLGLGKSFNYTVKVIGEAGEVLENTIYTFKKYGEEVLSTGEKIGRFSESQKDLIKLMGRSNATFGNAVRRVVMWGAASRLIYGGISNLKQSLGELADIEVGIAQLRMVMSPLESDFDMLSKSAVGFAKQYGVPVTDVLKSMRVFAQQGLAQAEVIDRTQTATLAANVTTLSAKEATEALTAAMKSFREEGDSAVRFLDSWSEVEAKHAITADDMANAIKKSAAAAKNAGFTFDELNGIVASIGAVTRQSGKEVGTAMRFIFRRVFSEKGPKELAKLNIPTLTGEGENRRGFDILNDLAMAWKDLTSAQKLNIAQALGGTRQYNALLVAMDNWDEALRGISNSTNSKGSAERRNLEIMKTYTKQLEQTRAAATELKMEFGKVVLPTFKVGLKALKNLLEGISSIPGPVKAAMAALGGMFVLGAKGINIFDTLSESLSKGLSAFGSFKGQFSKQLDIAKFEIFGKQSLGLDTFELKTIRPLSVDGSQIAEVGKSFKDFNSILGMAVYGLREVGVAYNDMLGAMVGKGGKGLEYVGEKLEKLSGSLGKAVVAGKIIPGWADDILLAGAGALGEGAGAAGHVTDFVGEKLGKGAESWAKNFASANTGLVKALAPLAITAIAAYKAVDGISSSFIKATKSASDFEKYMDRHRRQNESQLKNIRSLSMEYGRLSSQIEQINKVSQPETKARRQDLGTYEAPLVTLQKVQKEVTDLSNQLADQNSALVLGYDRLGNAILKTTANFKGFLQEVDKLKVREGIGKELEILARYTEDLTKTGGSEKIKQALKDLLDSTPIFGDLLGKQIKIAPIKVLEDASKRLNKLINLKNKAPLSTAANKDIEDLQEALGKARNVFNDTYSDFDRVYKKILSRSTLQGLDQFDIEQILGSDELKEAYQLRLTVDPKFELAKDITWQDIMGKELLSLSFPKAAGLVDVSAQFTKAAIESAGVSPRGKDDKGRIKALSGDLITLVDKASEEFDMAGDQAIIRMRQTADGVYEWVAQYFNTKTLKLEEKPLNEIEPLIDQVFPLQAVQEGLESRIDTLNTFVSGAAAGLVGLSKKAFKKDFDLGARFFSGVPTTTILQGEKGFTPGTGFGPIPLQKDWQKEIVKFYLEPMEELRKKSDQLNKLTIEGLKDVDLAESDLEQITRLLDTLKNNQIVQQFRAVWVDLMKEVSDGQRILRETLAVQKMRNELDRETAGLMSGTIKGLANIDTGINTVGGLSVKQRLVREDSDYSDAAKRVQALQSTIDANLDMLDKAQRALVAIDEIDLTATGFGAKISPDRLEDFVKEVAVEQTPQEKLLKPTQSIEQHTADTVVRLDAMLANMGDTEALMQQWERVTQYLGPNATKGSDSALVKAMDRAVKIRGIVEDKGNQKAVIAINDTIDRLVNKLVESRGFTSAANLVGTQGIPFTTQITKAEFLQRATRGADTEVLVDAIKRFSPTDTGGVFGFFKKSSFEQSDELAKLRKLQESDGKSSIKNIRQVAKATAAAAAIAAYRKAQSTRVVAKLDEQIKQLDIRIKQQKESGKTEKELRDLSKKRAAIVSVREESQKSADFYGMVTALSAMTTGAAELGMALGLTEKQVKLLGVGAVGTYTAVKLASKVTGKEMPESAKKFGQSLKDAAKAAYEKGEIDKGTIKDATKYGIKMTKDITKRGRQALGPVAAGITRNVEETDVDKLAAKFEEFGPTGDYESLIRESFGEDIEKLAVKTARGANAEESAKNIQAAIVAFAAATMADFIAKQSDDKVRIATLTKQAEEQAEAWVEIAEKYPLAFQKALDHLNGRVQDAEDSAAKITTRKESLIQDPDRQKNLTKSAIETGIIDPIIEKLREAQSEVEAVLAGMSFKETIQGNIKVLEDLAKAERQRRDELAITSRFNPQAILNKSLSGFVPDIGAPLSEEQMSTQQRVYAESDQVYKNLLTQYASVGQSVESMIQNMKNLKAHIAESTDIINAGVDEDAVKAQKLLIEEYNIQLREQETILTNVTQKLREFAETKQALDAFSEATYKLKDALKEVGIQETVDALLVDYRSNMSNLFGGGGLMAPQMVTPREELDAARVGVTLTNLVSNQYDKMRSDLLNRLEGAEGMDAIRIRQDLRNLPELQRRQQEAESQRTEIEELRRQLAPFEQNMTDLARARTLPGMGEDQIAEIDRMMTTISEMMRNATRVMSPQELTQELSMALEKGVISQLEFDRAKSLIDDAGPRQFRGIPEWQRRSLTGPSIEAIKSALKAVPTFKMQEMQTAVTDPITSRLDLSNALLASIAETYGIDMDQFKSLQDKLIDKLISESLDKKLKEPTPADVFRKTELERARTTGYYEPPPKTPAEIFRESEAVRGQSAGLADTTPETALERANRTAGGVTTLPPSAQGIGGVKQKDLGGGLPFSNVYTPKIGAPDFSWLADVWDWLTEESEDIKAAKEARRKLREQEKLDKELGRASGGRIFGEGGPREDKVPAYLSPGEFVIRAHAAQKIGYSNLETMNKKGAVPAFANGGVQGFYINPKTGEALPKADLSKHGSITQGSKLDFLNPQRSIIQTPGDKVMNAGYDVMSMILFGKAVPGALKAIPGLAKSGIDLYKRLDKDIMPKNTSKNNLKNITGFESGGTYRINPKTGKSFYKPNVKKAMNPNLAGVLGAAGAIGKGAIDIDAWKELLGIGALQRIYEGKGGLLDYAEGAMMTFPGAAAAGKLTAGGTKLATTTGKSLVKLFKGLGKAKKTKSAVTIPTLKSTNDAMEFGKIATPEQLAQVAKLQEIKKAESAKLLAAKKYNEAMETATESQFYREVIEMSEGKLKVPGSLKTKPKAIATDPTKELGLDMSLEGATTFPKRGMPEGIEKYLTGSKPSKLPGISPDRLMQTNMESVELGHINKVLQQVDDTAEGKRILTDALETYKGKEFSRDSLIKVLEKAKGDKELLREIIGYGELLGYGAEGIVLGGTSKKTAGQVVRLSDIPFSDEYLKGIQASKYVNPIKSSKTFEKSGIQAIRSEKLDPATSVINRMHEKARTGALSPEEKFFQETAHDAPHKMRHTLIREGKIKTIDMSHSGNVGYTTKGQARVIDYGAVAPTQEMGLEHAAKVMKASQEITAKRAAAEAARRKKKGVLQGMDFSDEATPGGYAIDFDSEDFLLSTFADGGVVGWLKNLLGLGGFTMDPKKIKGAGVRDHYKELEEQMKELDKNKFDFGGAVLAGRVPEWYAKQGPTDYTGLKEEDKDFKGFRYGPGEKYAGQKVQGMGDWLDSQKKDKLKEELAKEITETSPKDTGPKFLGHTPKTKHDRLERPKFAQELYKRDADINPRASGENSPEFKKARAERLAVWGAWKNEKPRPEILTPTPPPELNLPKSTGIGGIYTWVDDKGIKHFSNRVLSSEVPREKPSEAAELWGRTTAAAAISAQKAYRPLPDKGVLDYLLPEEYDRAGKKPAFGLQAQYDTPLHRNAQGKKQEGLDARAKAVAELQIDKDARTAIREIPANVDMIIKDLQRQLSTASGEEVREIKRKIETAQNFRKQALSEFETDPSRNLILGPNGRIAYQALDTLKDAAYSYLIPEKYRGQTSANDPKYMEEQKKIQEVRDKQNELYKKDPGSKFLADTSGMLAGTGQQVGMGADKTYHGQTLSMLNKIIEAKPDDLEFLKTVLKHRNNLQNIVTNMSRGLPFSPKDEARAVLARKLIASPFTQDIINEGLSEELGLSNPWHAYSMRPALYKEYKKMINQYGADGSKWPEGIKSKEDYIKALGGDRPAIAKTRPTMKEARMSTAKMQMDDDKDIKDIKTFLDYTRELNKLEKQMGYTSTLSPRAVTQVMRKQEEIEDAFSGGFLDTLFRGRSNSLLGTAGVRGADGGSLPVYHQGGEIRKTGPIFAQKGETVLPKAFADGGMVDASMITQTLTTTSAPKLDTDKLVDKLAAELESVELKVEDKEMKVEDKELKVEDKELKVEDKELTIAENNITVNVDTGDAAERISSAINSALSSATVKVEATGAVGVGGEELNQLSESMAQINDRVFALSSGYDEEIKIIKSKLDATADVDLEASIKRAVDNELTTINKNISDTNSDLDRVRSSVERNSQQQQQIVSDIEYKLNNALSKVGA